MVINSQLLRQIRKEKKMTLRELSNATGLAYGYLSQIELSKAIPSLKSINKIAAGLNVAVSTLLVEDVAYPKLLYPPLLEYLHKVKKQEIIQLFDNFTIADMNEDSKKWLLSHIDSLIGYISLEGKMCAMRQITEHQFKLD